MEREWYIQDSDSPVVGPVTTTVLLKGIHAGKVPATASVCIVGAKQWVPISDHPEIAALLRQAASAVQAVSQPIARPAAPAATALAGGGSPSKVLTAAWFTGGVLVGVLGAIGIVIARGGFTKPEDTQTYKYMQGSYERCAADVKKMQAEAPSASAVPTATNVAKLDPLAIPCVGSTWNTLVKSAPAEWTKKDCGGGRSLSYSRHDDKDFVFLIKVEKKGAKSTALMKPAMQAIFPNLGEPARSIGWCEPRAAELKDIEGVLGSDGVAQLKTELRNRGGERKAIFKVGSTSLAIDTTIDEGDKAVIKVTPYEEQPEDKGLPEIPWSAKASCDK